MFLILRVLQTVSHELYDTYPYVNILAAAMTRLAYTLPEDILPTPTTTPFVEDASRPLVRHLLDTLQVLTHFIVQTKESPSL